MLIGDITAREAVRNPRKTAIVEAGSARQVTYRELEDRVARLAGWFAALPGIAPGERVAVLALNRIEYVECYFACARAGLIAMGLNWRLAVDELERVLSDSAPRVVVYESGFAAEAAELQRRLDIPCWLGFGEDSDGSYEGALQGAPQTMSASLVPDESTPALIIYTGGTTGTPKGAIHTNRSLLAAMVNNTVAERVVPEDRYLLLGQMFHSASVLALNYLMHGASVILLPRFEPRAALETIDGEQATATLAFPAMINYLLDEAGRGGFNMGSLRNVQYGGGPIAPEVILTMMEALPCTFIQCYGSSEHVGVTFLSQDDHVEARAGRHAHRLRSCGREAHLTRVTLMGPSGSPVPRDGKTIGEIFVKSATCMDGYWKRPELTTELWHRDGGWATGDLAVWDDAGYVFIVDRAKDMIISGGENIYPAQVENAIAAHPAVLEVAVVGTPDPLWGEIVSAFVVLKSGRTATVAEIQDVVRNGLGSYQKPRTVDFIDELPKAPTGKVAKRVLATRSVTPAGDGPRGNG